MNSVQMTIEQSKKSDSEDIKILLIGNDLPVEDLDEENIRLFIARIEDSVAGVIGLEHYNMAGLLRSLAVKDPYKNQHIGEKLISHLLGVSKQLGIQELYLLTTTAEKYFEKFNFKRTTRDTVPHSIQNTREFVDICPLSAVIMKKEL